MMNSDFSFCLVFAGYWQVMTRVLFRNSKMRSYCINMDSLAILADVVLQVDNQSCLH